MSVPTKSLSTEPHAKGTHSTGTLSTGSSSRTLLVRYFAAARAAAGLDEEPLSVPEHASVDDVLARLRELHPESLPRILTAAGFLLDGVAVRDTATLIGAASEIDILPPFAGG